MLAEFCAYLTTLIGKWLVLALLMNGLAGLVARYWRPFEIPQKIVFWVSIAVVFLAGFEAWREEHQSLLLTQQQLLSVAEVKESIDPWKASPVGPERPRRFLLLLHGSIAAAKAESGPPRAALEREISELQQQLSQVREELRTEPRGYGY